MGFLSTCCQTFASLSRGAAKAAKAKMRFAGLIGQEQHWSRRAEICERCPMRTIRRNISYCGLPLMEQMIRDPVIEGCGCPVHAKAKDPSEHCPLNGQHQPSTTRDAECNCKWCISGISTK